MTSVLRLAICAAVLAVSSAWAGPYSIESVETSGTTFATGAPVGSTFERMRITQGGLVGISNSSPIAKLDVGGDISASGVVQVSGSSLACASSINGAMRWNATSDTLQICTGSGWKSLVSGTAGVGTLTGTGSATAVAYWSGTSGLTYDTDGFYWDATNNRLGIGTSAPELNLEASGGSIGLPATSGATQTGSMRVGATGTSMVLDFGVNNTGTIASWIQSTRRGVHATNYNLALNPNGGNVGVATATPTSVLQVSGTFTVSNSAQVTTPSLYVGTNGSVGMGISSPRAALDIQTTGQFETSDTTTGNYLQLTQSGGTQGDGQYGPGLVFSKINSGRRGGAIASVQTGSDADQMGLAFFTHAGASSNDAVGEVMRITSAGKVGISNTSPIAKLDVNGTISASDAIQVSGSSLTCSSAIKGAIRYSNTSSTLEYCNSTAWTSLGPSATSVPAFSVNKNAAQSLSSGVATKVTWEVEDFDTNNNFASDRFTPTIAGKYLVSAAGYCTSVSSHCQLNIYKNGAAHRMAYEYHSGDFVMTNTVLVDMNGSTDYLEVYAAIGNAGGAISNAGTASSFTGTLIAPGNAAGGGGATPGGADTQVQFNDGGSALGADADYTWNKTSNVLTITGTASATVHNGTNASITTIYNPGSLSGNTVAANSVSSTLVSATNISGTSGYFGSKVGLGRMAPVATLDVLGTISASDAIQVSGSSLTCSSAIKGSIRYSNTSSTIEYCNSTAWTSLGPSDTTVPAFSVHKNGTNQTITTSTWTKLTWSTERFDTNNNFASDKFTPTVAGKYSISAALACTSATTTCAVAIYKNGSIYSEFDSPPGTLSAETSAIIDMNGSTDYVEAYAYNGGGTIIIGTSVYTYFTGSLISSGNGAGGGGSTPGGSDTQVQFNDGGSALGGDAEFTWNKTTNALTVTGDINYTGLLTDTSDRRQKTAIHDFPGDALERVMKLKPVTFEMKKGGNGVEYGFIAQDVLPLFPELVRDRDDTLSLNYIGMMAPMVKAMQQMKIENDTVAAQNRQLRETLHSLAAEVKTLRKAVERSRTLH